jgi:hypothetical protein
MANSVILVFANKQDLVSQAKKLKCIFFSLQTIIKDIWMAKSIILVFQCMRTSCLDVHGIFCNFNIVDYHVITYSFFTTSPFLFPPFGEVEV